MGNRPSIWRAVAAFALILSLSIPAFAADNVGTITGGGPFIQWDVKVAGAGVELSILDPEGNLIVKSFNGRSPIIRVSDLGSNPVDGQYNYRLSVSPNIPAHVAARLAAARENNDDAEIKKIQKDAKLGSAIVQSGTITLLNGGWVNPNAGPEEGANDATGVVTQGTTDGEKSVSTNARPSQPVAQDQVIPDDLIVQGSTCTGFDCVNNESFGFDTFRMKENNLRIHFEDTSTSAGYPANDWRLVANDSASGGANKFVVEDSTNARNPMTIEAAAPADSLYVDSTGNIGLQQSAPGLDLHLTMSDTPAIRLEQTNAGGFTAQTWDIGANEANFFIRDLTGGSKLSFRIRPGAPTSSVDINADGDVSIGSATADKKLDVYGSSTLNAESGVRVRGTANTVEIADIFVAETGNLVLSTVNGTDTQAFIEVRPEDDQYGFVVRESTGALLAPFGNVYVTDATDDYLSIDVNSVKSGDFTLTASGRVGIGTTTPGHPLVVGTNTSNGNGAHVTTGGVWTNGSSREFKNHIEELSADAAMSALAQLTPVTYNYKNEPEETYVGFIAEEVPELVAQTSTGRHYLSPMDIVATLTKVVQEQQKTIEQLTAKVQKLENNQ